MSSIAHYYTHLLPSKVIIMRLWRAILRQCLCPAVASASDLLLSPKQGHSSPLVFGPRLLWPNGRPSQLLLSTCFTFVLIYFLLCCTILTIFSEPEFTFTFALCCRQSVCRLSVCNPRAPYSAGWNFRQRFYAISYLGHPLTFTENFTEIVPGEPLRRAGAKRKKGSQIERFWTCRRLSKTV